MIAHSFRGARLSAIAAVVGLTLAMPASGGASACSRSRPMMSTMPFWSRSAATAFNRVWRGPGLLAAVVTACCGAQSHTRPAARLRETTRRRGLKFGGVWTVLIVTQVALTVTSRP